MASAKQFLTATEVYMQLNEGLSRQEVAMQSTMDELVRSMSDAIDQQVMNLFSSPWHVPRGEKEGGGIRFQMPRPRILVEQKEDKVVLTVQHTY
jgi:hypothetical protein